MMVSKVAVIALVAIIAVPILLGYAMNLEQVTETDYKTAGDSVNVTPLLQNGLEYTYANADAHRLNSTFTHSNNPNLPFKPFYNSVTPVKTTMPMQQFDYPAGQGGAEALYPQARGPFSNWQSYYLFSNITGSSTGYLSLIVYDLNVAPLLTFDKVVSMDWDFGRSTINVSYYGNSIILRNDTAYISDPAMQFQFIKTGTYTADGYLQRVSSTPANNQYADLSAGFTIRRLADYDQVRMPDKTRSVLYTINLDSITEADYNISFGGYPGYILSKSTVDGVVTWQVRTWSEWGYLIEDEPPAPDVIYDLYYDPSRSDNTYQIYVGMDYGDQGYPNQWGATIYSHTQKLQFRYVGGWPTAIGAANYYQIYEHTVSFEYWTSIPNMSITFGTYPFFYPYATHTPTMRVDAAEFRAMEYPIVENKTYAPGDFKTYPSTTINNPTIYGSSIAFGGFTYPVSNGNITLGTHQIPVKGLVLSSIPNTNGGYDNMIGDTFISSTAQPSTITFNGKWSASISTTAQQEYEYTKTEWIAGGFAWDGVDQNFLMVGLITCLGVFIALGIYARRSGARVLPLMIVCGGAALLFFVML